MSPRSSRGATGTAVSAGSFRVSRTRAPRSRRISAAISPSVSAYASTEPRSRARGTGMRPCERSRNSTAMFSCEAAGEAIRDRYSRARASTARLSASVDPPASRKTPSGACPLTACLGVRHLDMACSDQAAGPRGGRRYDRTVAATTPETYLADLNPAQREAVLHTEGPVLVIAGAGSGKTRVLTRRIAHLLGAVGVKPPEILAITFTNKAAGEMRERVEQLVGPPARPASVMTFHSACGRILRRGAQRLGYRSNFTIYDQADQIRLVKRCLEELERDPKRFTPRGIHSQISSAKNTLVGPEEYTDRVASFYDQTVAEVYDLYQKRLFASNAVDFDDMLFLTVDVLERFPEARQKWQEAFRYVLVDEYQDTNHAQYRLLQLLAERPRNRLVCGDPAQSVE